MPKAISLSRVFENIGYKPHKGQIAIHSAMATCRFRVVCAGRRTGKSTVGGHELTPLALQAMYEQDKLDPYGLRREYWIVGPEYTDAEKEFRVFWNDLTKLGIPVDKPGSYYDAVNGNMHVSLWGGRFLVHGKSAKYPGTLVGEGLSGVILAEAAKLKPIVWHKYLRPTLADQRGWALMTSTPEGRNWFYDEYKRGQRGDAGWWSTRMPSWVNEIIFPGGRLDPEIADLSIGMSEEKFKQEIGAEFTEFVGQVYKSWDEDVHVGNVDYDPRWPLYIATDYGFTNPSVALFIQVDVFDNVRVIDEYYMANRTDEEFANEVLNHPRLGPLVQRATQLYPDPEDPSAAKVQANKWKVGIQGGTGGSLKDRIDLIRRWLKLDYQHVYQGETYELPKFLVSHRCVNLAREMGDYRYPENKTNSQNDKEAPLKKDDHAPEALSRFFGGYFGRKSEHSVTRIRRAKVRSR